MPKPRKPSQRKPQQLLVEGKNDRHVSGLCASNINCQKHFPSKYRKKKVQKEVQKELKRC